MLVTWNIIADFSSLTLKMLQERKTPVSVTQSTTSSVGSQVSVSSESHMRRKVELVEDYFEDAKKYQLLSNLGNY